LPGGAILSVRPVAGLWHWTLISRDGGTGRYGRGYRLLSACITAADRAAEAEAGKADSVHHGITDSNVGPPAQEC
jgi:hypothetical protein